MGVQYIGQRLGDYVLTKHLGEGGFADVYLGQHVYLHTDDYPIRAAIKVLKGEFTAKETTDLLNEAQTIIHLKHPHIVPLITFSVAKIETQNRPFLVMDYAPHGSLDKRYPRGTELPLAMVVSYVKQIVQALQYAHDHRVVHRDIKPANFLLGRNEEVLLSDFGIAIVAHRTGSWEAQKLAGSWAYAAPEHFDARAVPSSDQYSLGVVVYQWLSGVPPFNGNFLQLGYQHHCVSPPSLRERIPTISPEVERVVMKALSKDPEQRFESVRAFSDALERACQLQQSTTIPPMLNREVSLRHQTEKDFMLITDENQAVHVLIEALPTELIGQVRMPLNFVWVLDHSATMKGAKLRSVKEAMKLVIDRLQTTDCISVVIFDDTSQIIISSTPANDPVSIKAIIDRIGIREVSTTNRFMSRGIIDGLNELRRGNIPNAVSRMIVLTDGVTSGDADLCRQLAHEAASAGIAIYPIGIGSNWDEDLLNSIGELSGGMPAEFIQNPSDALSIFEQQVQSAVDIAIRNATLILHLPVGVTPKKAVQVLPIISDLGPSVLSDRQIVIPLGDLEKDKPESVLVELLIDSHPAGPFRIARVELSYDVPIIGKACDNVIVTFTNDVSDAEKVNTLVMEYIEKAKAASRIATRPLS